jgi:MoxR-like ATPase
MSDADTSTADVTSSSAVYTAIESAVDEIVIGNAQVIEGLTIALLTRGHVLLEGVPGVAKTTIANAFSQALGGEYARIQMTPDVLPADITGTYVYRETTGEFELRKGPLFANIVVADEINRATPKTQSALLEAMQERQVTIEGETLTLPDPFLVIATQNPIEMEGTFELAEAQRDRFMLKYEIDLPTREEETALFDRFNSDPQLRPEVVDNAVDIQTLSEATEEIIDVHISDPVREYILDIVEQSRAEAGVEHGGSPRATLALLDGGKARAAIHNREYVLPDDVKTLVEPVLIHRLVRNTDARLSDRSPTDIVQDVVESVPTPSAESGFTAVQNGDPTQSQASSEED